MSNQHTDGMLIVGEVGDRGNLILADSERMSLLTIVDEDGTDFAAFYNAADARRLAACWNACAGFTTEELEETKLLQTRLVEAFARISSLLGERNSMGLAIDAAIRDGVVPEQHPLRSRLEMLANHRQREQELLAALEHILGGALSLPRFAEEQARAAVAKAKGE